MDAETIRRESGRLQQKEMRAKKKLWGETLEDRLEFVLKKLNPENQVWN